MHVTCDSLRASRDHCGRPRTSGSRCRAGPARIQGLGFRRFADAFGAPVLHDRDRSGRSGTARQVPLASSRTASSGVHARRLVVPDLGGVDPGRTYHPLLLQVGPAPTPSPSGPRVGPYRFGLKVGKTDEGLREALDRRREAGVNILGSADHTVTHSGASRTPSWSSPGRGPSPCNRPAQPCGSQQAMRLP
jgi:hypothetical protein